MQSIKKRQPYQPPILEVHPTYVLMTGLSLPINTTSLPELEMLELGFEPKQ
jgi:hypothetical protein